MSGGVKTDASRAKAAALLGQGASVTAVVEAMREDHPTFHRATLWRWQQDPEFKALVDQVVQAGLDQAVQHMADLAPLAVEAFEVGLRSRHKVVLSKDGDIVDLPDASLAVKTADLVTKRIPALTPKAELEVNVEASERLVELIRRVDSRSGADGGTPPPPPV